MPSIITMLDEEWSRLSTNREARWAVTRWAAAHPVLVGVRDLVGLVRRCHDRHNTNGPRILRALAEMACTDDLAARTLLQALMPGILKIARQNRDDPDAIDDVVSLAWERIRTYPLRRQGSVAANVLWDVRSRYWRQRRFAERTSRKGDVDPGDVAGPTSSTEDRALARLTLGELAAARRSGIVSKPTYELIVRTRIAGTPLDEIARQRCVSRRSLISRRFKAQRRLRAYLGIDQPAA